MSAIVWSHRLIKSRETLHHSEVISFFSVFHLVEDVSQFPWMNAIIKKYGFLFLALFVSYTIMENIALWLVLPSWQSIIFEHNTVIKAYKA